LWWPIYFALAKTRRTQRKTGEVYLSVLPVISFAFFAPLRELYLHRNQQLLNYFQLIHRFFTAALYNRTMAHRVVSLPRRKK
jgi:hypothetical protein